ARLGLDLQPAPRDGLADVHGQLGDGVLERGQVAVLLADRRVGLVDVLRVVVGLVEAGDARAWPGGEADLPGQGIARADAEPAPLGPDDEAGRVGAVVAGLHQALVGAGALGVGLELDARRLAAG